MSLNKYGIYAEDPPFNAFLEAIIPRILESEISNKIELALDTQFSMDKKPKDGISNFLKTFTEAITQGCLKKNEGGYGLRFCVLGLDCDEENLVELQQKIRTKLEQSNQTHYAVICIAKKSIEFWMWYHKKEQGLLFENANVSIYELHNNQTMKPLIYNRKRSGSKGAEIAQEIAGKTNIKYLREHSASFEAFFQELNAFITTHIGQYE